MEVQITHICSITFQSYIDSKLQKSIETNFFLMTYFQNEIPLFMIFITLERIYILTRTVFALVIINCSTLTRKALGKCAEDV